MKYLKSIDTALLLFFNGLHNPVLDFIMYWASNKWIWIPLYLYMLYELYRRYPKYVTSLVICAVIMVALSDQLTSTLIKNVVRRLRPCHDPMISDDVHLVNGECGGSFGFVSSHSSNSFAVLAYFLFLFKSRHRKLRYILIGWAVLISYSRVYLAAHYPGDVLCGALIGTILGIAAGNCYNYYLTNFRTVSAEDNGRNEGPVRIYIAMEDGIANKGINLIINQNMKNKKIFLAGSFLVSFSVCFAQDKKQAATSQQNNLERPKLVVGIVVDQMRYDYLYKYWQKYSDGGFKRLLGEGFSFADANYNYTPTYTGPGHACIYTGTTPSSNGIVSNEWFDRKANRSVYCTEDSSVITIGSSSAAGKMSPKNLLTTTVTDELRLATNFKSKVIGVSVKDRGAILPAGHLANAAYWHDPAVNNWITSSYYMEQLPKWVVDFNNRKVADSLLSQTWNTLLPIAEYTESTSDDSPYEGKYRGENKPVFPHELSKIKSVDAELIRKTPMGNTFIKEFAQAAIAGENLGKGEATDFITVSFSCTDYVGHMFGINAIETEDTYLRLDSDLASFLVFLDNWVGKKNILLFITADHGAANNAQFSSDKNIPSGFFSSGMLADSLNTFLVKKFGKANYISDAASNCIYLNHWVLDSLKLNIDAAENTCVTYLANYKGVAVAVAGDELEKSNCRSGVTQFIQNGFNSKRSGDVMYELEPAYMDWGSKTGTTHGSSYSYDTHVPLIFYGWKIPQGKSVAAVAIADIAPTISSMLHIENPNGCNGTPLQFTEK